MQSLGLFLKKINSLKNQEELGVVSIMNNMLLGVGEKGTLCKVDLGSGFEHTYDFSFSNKEFKPKKVFLDVLGVHVIMAAEQGSFFYCNLAHKQLVSMSVPGQAEIVSCCWDVCNQSDKVFGEVFVGTSLGELSTVRQSSPNKFDFKLLKKNVFPVEDLYVFRSPKTDTTLALYRSNHKVVFLLFEKQKETCGELDFPECQTIPSLKVARLRSGEFLIAFTYAKGVYFKKTSGFAAFADSKLLHSDFLFNEVLVDDLCLLDRVVLCKASCVVALFFDDFSRQMPELEFLGKTATVQKDASLILDEATEKVYLRNKDSLVEVNLLGYSDLIYRKLLAVNNIASAFSYCGNKYAELCTNEFFQNLLVDTEKAVLCLMKRKLSFETTLDVFSADKEALRLFLRNSSLDSLAVVKLASRLFCKDKATSEVLALLFRSKLSLEQKRHVLQENNCEELYEALLERLKENRALFDLSLRERNVGKAFQYLCDCYEELELECTETTFEATKTCWENLLARFVVLAEKETQTLRSFLLFLRIRDKLASVVKLVSLVDRLLGTETLWEDCTLLLEKLLQREQSNKELVVSRLVELAMLQRNVGKFDQLFSVHKLNDHLEMLLLKVTTIERCHKTNYFACRVLAKLGRIKEALDYCLVLADRKKAKEVFSEVLENFGDESKFWTKSYLVALAEAQKTAEVKELLFKATKHISFKDSQEIAAKAGLSNHFQENLSRSFADYSQRLVAKEQALLAFVKGGKAVRKELCRVASSEEPACTVTRCVCCKKKLVENFYFYGCGHGLHASCFGKLMSFLFWSPSEKTANTDWSLALKEDCPVCGKTQLESLQEGLLVATKTT